MCRRSEHTRGFTLAEILIVVVLIGIVSAVAVPLFSSFLASKQLDVAAEEVANAMRFALGEANRTGGYILVDASPPPGYLRLYNSNASGSSVSAVTDPLTKSALAINVTSSTYASGMSLTAQFMGGGSACNQLLVGPGTQLQAFNNGSNTGLLQPGSGVVLTLGSQTVTVAINEVTGLVTLP